MQSRDPDPDLPVSRLRERLVATLVEADREGAAALVGEAIAARLGAPALLVDLLGASLREVGSRWERGELSVAAEHWASQAVAEEVERVRQAHPPAAPRGLVAVVAAPTGERHALGARVIAALLQWRGWRVHLLGADLPARDLASFAAARDARLVALSVTLAEHLPAAAEAARLVRELPDAPRVLVGGAAFGHPAALPPGFPADAVASDAIEGVARAEELVGAAAPDLAAYLARIGARLQRLRRDRGLSQGELAAAAGLARSHLSAVESGRQNITLDAALRLARGVGASMEELLREAPDPR